MPPEGYRSRTETEIKRSRFITTLGRTNTETEARTLIAGVRAEFPDGRHHCMAFVLDDMGVQTARSSDDGEPAGTGGIPMMNSLVQAELVNITAVVTRYFGGIKLGASGLARAYGGCVAEATSTMPIVIREVHQVWAITLTHAEVGRSEEELLRAGATILERTYGDTGVGLRFTFPKNPAPILARITQGAVVPLPDGEQILEVLAEHT